MFVYEHKYKKYIIFSSRTQFYTNLCHTIFKSQNNNYAMQLLTCFAAPQCFQTEQSKLQKKVFIIIRYNFN